MMYPYVCSLYKCEKWNCLHVLTTNTKLSTFELYKLGREGLPLPLGMSEDVIGSDLCVDDKYIHV